MQLVLLQSQDVDYPDNVYTIKIGIGLEIIEIQASLCNLSKHSETFLSHFTGMDLVEFELQNIELLAKYYDQKMQKILQWYPLPDSVNM